MSNGSISMSKDDLEQAYRVRDPLRAGHQAAEAVVVGPEGITVLATQNPAGEAEHTWVLRLTLDGDVTWETSLRSEIRRCASERAGRIRDRR